MRIVGAASRFCLCRRRDFRGLLLKHWQLWIPVLSLLATRPIATFSFPLALHHKRYLYFATSRMAPATRKTRSASSEVKAAKSDDSENVALKSPRKRARKSADDAEDSTAPSAKTSSPKKKTATKVKGAPKAATKKATTTKTKDPPAKKRARKTAVSDNESVASADSKVEAKKKKSPAKKKASDHQRITERDEIPKLWDAEKATANGSYTFKIASWNVAGLRALVKKEPNALAELCKEHDLDMLCLQETKLQEMHVDDPKMNFRGLLKEHGYDDHWSCSTVKKGYSGTAVFVKRHGKNEVKQTEIGSFFAPQSKTKGSSEAKKAPSELPVNPETLTPLDVSCEIGKEIDDEGRTIVCEFPFATITNVYVPNSGQTLQRLDYRTNEWDKDFLEFHQKKQSDRGLPVIWLGDLNIAHKASDIWNEGAKHLAKQAGVTPQERASFQEQLDAGFIDAFRELHPTAKGHYSYWSQRAGSREPNKGLRLDYFICSPDLFSEDSKAVVRDSYIIKDQLGSDHCPVVLELEIKSK